MKKLFGVVAALAMVMAVAVSAKACSGFMCWQMPKSEIKVENIGTDVTTVAKIGVNTGDNMQMGGSWSKMTTGGIVGVSSVAQSQVNYTTLPSCNCSNIGEVTVKNIHTDVATIAKVNVNTGDNKQMSFGKFTMPSMTTGGVQSIATMATSGVNYVDFSVTE